MKYLPPINEHIVIAKGNPFMVLFGILYSRKNITLLLFTFSLMMTVFSIVPYLSPFFVSNTGMDEKDLPLVYFFAGLFTFYTSRKIGQLSDQYGKFNLFIIVALLANIPIYLLTQLTETKVYITIIVTTAFMILVSGRSVPGFAMITGSVEPKIRGGFLSINSSIQQVTAGIASLISGMIIYRANDGRLMNFDLVGYNAIFFCLLSVILAYWMKPSKKPLR
jgi:predicted MFS family arabinose efflux permease